MVSVLRRCGSWRAMCVALAYVMAAFAQPVFAQRAGEIRVTAVHGDVQVQMAGVTTPLAANAILQLPATIRTGADGAVELRQGPTTIAAAGGTELLIPESAAQEGLIERIVQLSGNAFYNVGKRETTKLRVETPHLVAVIKGTQFNVAAQPESTTIALYEGRLEVRAPDDSDVVDLHAGEIAIRKRNDVSIRVLRMSGAAVTAPRARAGAPAAGSSGGSERGLAMNDDGAASPTELQTQDAQLLATRDVLGLAATDGLSGGAGSAAAAIEAPQAAIDHSDVGLSADLGGQPSVGADVALDMSQGVQADAQVGVDLGGATAGAALDVDLGGSGSGASVGVSADVGGATADVGVSAGVGAGAVDVGADVSVDAGPIAADVGASVGIDAGGAEVGADVGAGAGPVTADLGAEVGVGTGGVDLGADVGVGAGGADVGASTDVGVDPNAGQLGAEVGLDTPVAGVDAGVSVEDSGASVDAGLGDAVDVDLGVGTGGVDVSTDTGVAPVDDVVDTVDNVLDGLLTPRRRQ